MEFLIGIGIVLGLFVLFLLVRTALYKPYPEKEVPSFDIEVDKEKAIDHLAQMIRCKTVSYSTNSMEDTEEFEKFRKLLRDIYPKIHEHCEVNYIGRNGILYHWKGKRAEKPTVYMAHYDVVPAEEEAWGKSPFSGIIEDGYLWGRGTLDTKGTLCGIMEAAEQLISQGFVPQNDIYLSFSGEEEINGPSAADIVDFLEERGVYPHMVLDEGGAVVDGVIPGVNQKCALVGTGEKGKLHVKLSVKSKGGHASSPPPHSPIGILAKAIHDVETKPFQFRLSTPVKEMFDILGRHSTFLLRLVFANLTFFRPLFNLLTKKTGGEINALVRSTVAFTQLQASDAVNVFPPVASVVGDIRMMAGDTTQSIIHDLKRKIGNDEVEVEALYASEVRPFSKKGSQPWERLKEGIQQIWPETLVSPYLMIACSDSRHFTKICDNVFRFSAMELTAQERKQIHGHNERIPLEKISTTVKFFICMMMKS